ncbi:hypothetical protein D9613_006483 [Agrocybe pediades]|uniref:Probable methionine--tRNA ligase, mitochondrial n=1 Tax=Agrocybe pediades TaxID=84607 RepID=A0A8H4VJW2_9AGAR|nr:hypothetical protein D9613_006483 [Agrocybe pediades]
MLPLRSLSRCSVPTVFLRHASTTTKPFYITTPIFYPNASPHIGHLYSLVTGDVFARYQRLKENQEVRYLAGTDEHGLKIQKAARAYFNDEAGREKEFCDMLSERFRDLGKRANISNTCFMRTSSKEHHQAVENVWRNLHAKGYIYKSQYSGWYSVTDECFYTDSQVADGVSLETGAAVEWAQEENYMFRLSAFRKPLLEHFTNNRRSVYPEQYYDNVIGMLGGGADESFVLEDISISRPRSRLEWGVQVPDDPEQTVYVWFDALLIYLTGSGYPWASVAQQTEMGWPADIQIIGKDILRFHAMYLPAIILALSEKSNSSIPVALPKTLLTHAHWTSSQKKMSKSLGNVADPLEAMDKFGVDVVRFYMMRVGGRWRGDVDWSSEQLQKHQKEISAQLGNYFLRVTSPKILERANSASALICDQPDQVPVSLFDAMQEAQQAREESPDDIVMAEDVETDGQSPNVELLTAVLALPAKVRSNMDQLEAGQALAEIMDVLKLANQSITILQPWAKSTDPIVAHTTRTLALETLRIVGACLVPFMPETSERLLTGLGLDVQGRSAQDAASGAEGVLEKAGVARKVEVKDVKEIWERWEGREVKGVKLF